MKNCTITGITRHPELLEYRDFGSPERRYSGHRTPERRANSMQSPGRMVIDTPRSPPRDPRRRPNNRGLTNYGILRPQNEPIDDDVQIVHERTFTWE